MWQRDNTAQVWPYLSLIKDDQPLQQMIIGVINRHMKNIIKDPYANAIYKDTKLATECTSLATELNTLLQQHAITNHPA